MSSDFKRKLSIYLLLLCNSIFLCAQDNLDIQHEQALLLQIKNTEVDSQRLSIFVDLVQLVRYKNADKVIDYAHRGLQIAQQIGHVRHEAELLWLKGAGHLMKKDIPEAMEAFELSLVINSHNRDSTYAFALNGLARTYEILEEEEDALLLYKKVIFLGDSLGQPHISTLGMGNMARIYEANEDYESAKYFLFEALTTAEKHELKKIQAFVYTNLASIYINEKYYDTALVYVRKAIIQSTKRRDLPYIATSAYNLLSKAYFLMNDYERSLAAAETAIKIAEESEIIPALAEGLLSKMKTLNAMAQYEKALNQGFLILGLSKTPLTTEVELTTTELIADIHYAQKSYKNAFKYQKLYNQRKAKSFEKRQVKYGELAKLMLKLEREKLTNKDLSLQLTEGVAQLKNNKLFATGMILFAFFLLIVVLTLYSRSYSKRNKGVSPLSGQHAKLNSKYKKQLLNIIFILYPPIIIHLFIWGSVEASLVHASLLGILIFLRILFHRKNSFPLYWISVCFYLSIAFLPLYIGPLDTAFAGIVAVFLNAFYLSENRAQRILNYLLFPSCYICYTFLTKMQPDSLIGDPFGYELLTGLISICAIYTVVIYINKGITDSRLALSKNNLFLRQITDLNPHFIFAKDSEGRFTLANKALTQTMGKTHEELIGKHDNNLINSIHPDDQSSKDDIAVLKNGRTIDRKEEVIIDTHGVKRYFQTIKKPIYNENWEITGMLGVSTDITDIKLAQKERLEREATLNAIISSIPDPIFVIDANMNPIILNKAFYHLTDISSIAYKESIMDFLKRTLPQEFSQKYKGIIKRVLNGENYSGYDVLKTPNGKTHYEMSGTPFRDKNNNIIGAIMLGLNVTEKNKQRALINKQIQDLNQKNTELEKYIESNLSLENFAYLASHDLKAPLRTIISFSQLFERRVKKKINAEEKELLNFVIGASKNMEGLINDLLEYSRVNTKKISLTTFELKPLVKEILNELSLSVQEKKARFQLKDLPKEILADQTKFRRLLQNLVTNALKFSKQDKAARIMISAKEEADKWVFMVKDNGIGINEKYQNKIFLLFKRLHGDSDYAGTGIGLAMVKKIVEQHNGEVWVESEEGKGSKFYFSISKNL